MDFREFSIINKRRNKLWDPEQKLSIEFKALELAGEVGELCNKIKKLVRFKNGLPGGKSYLELQKEIEDEIADSYICLDLLTTNLGIDLKTVVIRKFNESSEKYKLPIIIPESGNLDHLTKETNV